MPQSGLTLFPRDLWQDGAESRTSPACEQLLTNGSLILLVSDHCGIK